MVINENTFEAFLNTDGTSPLFVFSKEIRIHTVRMLKTEGNKIKTINDLENKRDIVCKRKIKLKRTYFIYIYNLKTCSLKILKSSIFLI